MVYDKIFAFVMGACVGSFLNVCIYRLPKDISIVKPSSFCPKCNSPIRWFDNIPLISFIALGGRCRNCRRPISLRYPLVELITAVLFLFLYSRYHLTLSFLKLTLFFSLLVVVSFIDIDYHAIPAYLCFLGIAAGLAFGVYKTFIEFKAGKVDNLIIITDFKNLLFGLGFTYFFKFFGDVALNIYLSFKNKDSIEGEKEALGLGDVDFMGMVGLFLGIKAVVLTFFIAPFIAIIYSVFAIIFKKSHLIPYLPYLSLAAFISFLWGNNILAFLGF
ncbi:MAG: hypothetical protein B1H08_04535 [Candidatus Omnitrophica bacterium 4484_171]|nr:MAG: hypothetical protein B1H08_04535 [Candidatus Omnitrophica bacterium 4484_171]